MWYLKARPIIKTNLKFTQQSLLHIRKPNNNNVLILKSSFSVLSQIKNDKKWIDNRDKLQHRYQSLLPFIFSSPYSSSTNNNNTKKSSSLLMKSFKVLIYSAITGTLYFSYCLYKELHPHAQTPQSSTFPNGSPRKNLVILGTGWGAVSLLQDLDTSLYNVIVVSPRNYFLFTPLLTSTPVGTVNLKSIIEPIRNIIRRSKSNVIFYEASATDVDPKNKTITIKSTPTGGDIVHGNINQDEIKKISYDYLVVSIGAESTTFNIPGVNEHAIFMKEVADSERVRTKIMDNIERASFLSVDDPLRQKLLNFIVVGGGPTGVEFAAELQDFVKQDLSKILPDISKDVKVSLVEGLPNILNMFDKSLIEYTEKFLRKEDIDLKLNTMVKKVNPDSIIASCHNEEIEIPYGLLVWSTGIKPNVLCQNIKDKLDVQTERRGLLIDDNLRLIGAEDSVFALGDCTFHPGFLPTAQVAHQEGCYLAKTLETQYKIDQVKWEIEASNDARSLKNLNKKLKSLESKMIPFKYTHMGTLAYIGSDKAIADINIAGSQYKLSGGTFVFWFWRSVYLSMCISLRNRVMVTADWIKTYIFGRDSSV